MQASLAWLLSTALALAVLLPAAPLMDVIQVPYNRVGSAFYIGFYRLAWSAVISWIVVACVTGRAGPLNSVLSWPPFAPLGRLTFGIYLIHALVQQVDLGLYRAAEYYSPFKKTHRTLADFFLAAVLSAGLSLTLESPILVIEKWLWSSRNPAPTLLSNESFRQRCLGESDEDEEQTTAQVTISPPQLEDMAPLVS